MKHTTESRSAAGVGDSDHGQPTEYQRTSDRARSMGYRITPTEIEGTPAFLVSRGCMSRMLPDLAEVDRFLSRADVCGDNQTEGIRHA